MQIYIEAEHFNDFSLKLQETGWGCVKWIHVARYMNRWRAVVNAVMDLRILAPRS
jgi:hypothetical protein